MEEWLVYITEQAVVFINACALVVIVYATLEAFVSALKIIFSGGIAAGDRNLVWLRFGRWLVAGLTFQLAADIIETSISSNWEDLGRLAAIAVIRTILNFFINRDMEELREREKGAREKSEPALTSE